MEISTSLIEDIFGIPSDGRHIQDEEEDDNGVTSEESSLPFEVKAAEVFNAIPVAETSPITEENDDKKVKENKLVELKKKEKPKGSFADIFDEEDEAPKPVAVTEKPKAEVLDTPKPLVVPEAKQTAPKKEMEQVTKEVAKTVEIKQPRTRVADYKGAVPTVEEEIVADDDEDANDSQCEQWSSGDVWLLESPAPKYHKFYQEKEMALRGPRNIMYGGEIPFTKYFKELEELNCDITVQTADLEAIHQKMQLVQGLRERCRHIQQHVDQQYYIWERYVELFHGILCRVEYERGKQDGIYYEHMRDMEHYYCSVKSLHRITESVMRTLDGAFECLSRQVTIALPMREAERYGPRPISSEQKRYDALPPASQQNTRPEGSVPSAWNI